MDRNNRRMTKLSAEISQEIKINKHNMCPHNH